MKFEKHRPSGHLEFLSKCFECGRLSVPSLQDSEVGMSLRQLEMWFWGHGKEVSIYQNAHWGLACGSWWGPRWRGEEMAELVACGGSAGVGTREGEWDEDMEKETDEEWLRLSGQGTRSGMGWLWASDPAETSRAEDQEMALGVLSPEEGGGGTMGGEPGLESMVSGWKQFIHTACPEQSYPEENRVLSRRAEMIFPYFFFFLIFRAAPTAYGCSQARRLIRSVATSLCHSHSNKGSKPHLWPIPQLTAMLDPQPTEQGWRLNLQPHGCSSDSLTMDPWWELQF